MGYRSSIFPSGNGAHFLMVNKQMQNGFGVEPGDVVKVEMAVDAGPRVVRPPADLRRALSKRAKAQEAFKGLTPYVKKKFVHWIKGAKRPETRARRVKKTLEMLEAGKRP